MGIGSEGQTCGDSGGRTRVGTACGASMNLSPTSGLCVQHDPERAEAARALRVEGGRASGAAKRRAKAALPEGVPSAPRSLEDAVQWSSWAMRAIATGEIDARTGHEVGYLIARFAEAVNKRDLEKRLEKALAELKTYKAQRPRLA